MNYPSKHIEDAVMAFAKLPGIGKKTALRLVLHLMNEPAEKTTHFTSSIQTMRTEVKKCTRCYNFSDSEYCSICTSTARKKETLCVVESVRDVMAIENTGQYHGLYHVLGGVISPVDGIGPEQLKISSLEKRIETEPIEEIILALNPTIEGDTTAYYLSKRFQPFQKKISTISRGIAFGAELEYTDEVTLARSIATRIPYETIVLR